MEAGPTISVRSSTVNAIVSEQRHASTILAQLIEAQERERTRIARELHDDIGASLAIVCVDLMKAVRPFSGSAELVPPAVAEVYEQIQEIAKRVSRLSHQLHSPALEYLGLPKALQVECRESSELFRIPIVCSCRDVPQKLDKTVGLHLLRVVQEALLNAAKHSGATQVEVEAAGTPALLTVRVRDNGSGFDVEQSRQAAGLGLLIMRERMRLAGSELEIRSQPGQGTEVVCRAPLS
jgi:signal transduction histidine kinase